MKKLSKTVKLKGVIPKSKSVVFKTVKKDQTSFRITKKLLDGIYSKSVKLGEFPELRITIPINDSEAYTINCTITRVFKLKGV